MSATRQNALLACLLVHLILIVAVCAHDTLWLLKERVVTLSGFRRHVWGKLDQIPEAVLGVELDSRNSWRLAVATYTNAAGIEAGYGYFAPNIPATYTLVFEWHYPDGRVEYERPSAHGKAGQFRVTTLVEQIGRTDYDRWRNALIKLLANSAWQRHPDAISVRAFFGTITPPTVAQYRAGKRERTFTCLHVYDLRRTSSQKWKSIL